MLVWPPTSHSGKVWNIYLRYVFVAHYIFQCSSQIMSLASAVKYLEVWLRGICLENGGLLESCCGTGLTTIVTTCYFWSLGNERNSDRRKIEINNKKKERKFQNFNTRVCRFRIFRTGNDMVLVINVTVQINLLRKRKSRLFIQDALRYIVILLLLLFSPWAGLRRDQSSLRRLVWLWYAASWASS